MEQEGTGFPLSREQALRFLAAVVGSDLIVFGFGFGIYALVKAIV